VDALTLACLYSRATSGGGARQIDTFLGVLYLVQDYTVYGYVTNTGVRFILVVDDSDNKDGRYGLMILMPETFCSSSAAQLHVCGI
jgi:hypothetical protein